MEFAPLHILIVDDVHPALLERFDMAGLRYSYQPDIAADSISSELPKYNGIVVRSKIHLTKAIIENNPQLQLIARAGSGMDNVDEAVALSCGITLINCPEANCDAVGEQTLGMLLALAHNIVKGNAEIQSIQFDREGNRGFEVGARTVGIIGYGHTGAAFARKLRGLGCRVLAYDKYKAGFGDNWVQEVEYQDVLNRADVISFHVPLTAETEAWINTNFIDAVQRPFVLLNLSRGGIMNIPDVIDGLQRGKVTHLAIDVLENEKFETLTSSQSQDLRMLNEMQNVIITPHVGGWSAESFKRISEVLADKIILWQNKLKKDPRLSGQNARFVG